MVHVRFFMSECCSLNETHISDEALSNGSSDESDLDEVSLSAQNGINVVNSVTSPKVKRWVENRPSLIMKIQPLNISEALESFLSSECLSAPILKYKYSSQSLSKEINKQMKLIDSSLEDIAIRILCSKNDIDTGINEKQCTPEELFNTMKEYIFSDLNIPISDAVIKPSDMNLAIAAVHKTSRSGPVSVTVSRSRTLPKTIIESVCIHEAGTHLLRMLNEGSQVWAERRKKYNLHTASPKITTEEGLAYINGLLPQIGFDWRARYPLSCKASSIFRPSPGSRSPSLWTAAIRYYATLLASRMGFIELFNALEQFIPERIARAKTCLRAKRGMIQTSSPGSVAVDQSYFRGAVELLRRRKFLDFPLLYAGQINWEDLPAIRRMVRSELVRLPPFLSTPGRVAAYRRALEYIAQYNQIDSIPYEGDGGYLGGMKINLVNQPSLGGGCGTLFLKRQSEFLSKIRKSSISTAEAEISYFADLHARKRTKRLLDAASRRLKNKKKFDEKKSDNEEQSASINSNISSQLCNSESSVLSSICKTSSSSSPSLNLISNSSSTSKSVFSCSRSSVLMKQNNKKNDHHQERQENEIQTPCRISQASKTIHQQTSNRPLSILRSPSSYPQTPTILNNSTPCAAQNVFLKRNRRESQQQNIPSMQIMPFFKKPIASSLSDAVSCHSKLTRISQGSDTIHHHMSNNTTQSISQLCLISGLNISTTETIDENISTHRRSFSNFLSATHLNTKNSQLPPPKTLERPHAGYFKSLNGEERTTLGVTASHHQRSPSNSLTRKHFRVQSFNHTKGGV